VASQKLAKIHWQVPVDLAPPEGEILIHYGSPLVTAKNTVIVPVKTGATSFRVQAHDGTTGNKLWTLNTAYQPPFAGFMPGLGPTLSHHHLFVPDTAGGILVRANPDKAKGNITHLYFYGLENYVAHPQVYQQAVKISTPLTADAEGNLYFGFTVIGITPIGLRSGWLASPATAPETGLPRRASAETIPSSRKYPRAALQRYRLTGASFTSRPGLLILDSGIWSRSTVAPCRSLTGCGSPTRHLASMPP
jgi:hypothetical protein